MSLLPGETKRVNLTIETELYNKVKELAEKEYRSVYVELNILLEFAINNYKPGMLPTPYILRKED